MNQTVATSDLDPRLSGSGWQRSLAQAIRDPDELLDLLALPDEFREPARKAAQLFPLMVPRSYLNRMQPGNPHDPLLAQVLPLEAELDDVPGFIPDAVADNSSRIAPGLLQKYAGRALMIATGACAVHCRYCFRRHYPYGEEPRRLDEWNPAFEAIAADTTIHEVLLSGGDPLMLTDRRLGELISRLETIPHLSRLRIHSRLPIVLPDRVTPDLLELLARSRLRVWIVVHANHPAEIASDCAESLRTLVGAGLPALNQTVLLRGVNDSSDVLAELSERLIDLGVQPYYLHQLDRVAGAAHFEVPIEAGRIIMRDVRSRLPGYAVPQYVRETPGAPFKTPLE